MPVRDGVIGVDVGGTTTKAALVDGSNEIAARSVRPTDPSAATKGIVAIVEELLLRSAEVGITVRALGIGAAGFVGGEAIIFSPNLVYDDPQLGPALRGRFDLPVAVENDANAAAWAEYRLGAARGARHLALVTLGTGVGSGFVIDGHLLHGSTGAGAEFGHMVIDPDGPACTCGLRGCIEQFASGSAIARDGRAAVAEDPSSTILAFAGTADAITAEHVARAAREYDEAARAILQSAGTMLGIALSNISNLFDPEVIVLAGGVTRAGEPLLGPARDELVRATKSQKRRPMRLDVSTLGSDLGMLGAATLARELVGAVS